MDMQAKTATITAEQKPPTSGDTLLGHALSFLLGPVLIDAQRAADVVGCWRRSSCLALAADPALERLSCETGESLIALWHWL